MEKELYSNLEFFINTKMFYKRKFIQQKHLDYSIIVLIIFLMMTYLDISEGKNLQIREKDFGNITVNIKWFTYIQRFLQNTHRKYFQNEKEYNYIPNIRYVIFSIKFWLQLVNNVKIYLWTGVQIRKSTVSYPLRKLRMLANSEDLKKKHQSKAYYYHHIFTWKFNLSNSFRLNITLEQIYITYHKLHHCYIGNISVKSFTKNSNQQFIYCGINSNITIYPWHQNINIEMSHRPLVFSDIILTYSVIAPGKIISFPRYNESQFVKWVFYVYLLHSREYKLKLHIQVKKLYFIIFVCLNMNSSMYEIHDEPDNLSSKLKLNNKSIHTTSAFQCMIHMTSSLIPTTNILEYYSQVHNITTTIDIAKFKYSVINFSSPLYPLLSIVKIRTHAPSHLNITIKSFTSKYNYNTLCTYAGIFFYEEIREIYNEKRSMCVDHGNFYKYRNIYSVHSEILVVIYAYKGYGTLYVSMNISTTPCQLSLRNRLCTFGFYCKITRNYSYNIYRSLCKHFFKESVIESKAVIKVYAQDILSQKDEGCFIYQFTQEVNLNLYKLITLIYKDRYCDVRFHTTGIKGKITTYQVSGFFTGM